MPLILFYIYSIMAKFSVCETLNTHILVMLIVNVLHASPTKPFSSSKSLENNPKFIDGQTQYRLSVTRSNEPRFGQCWKDALVVLESGCKDLTDDVQHRLALRFANCMFVKNGLRYYTCEDTDEFSQCTKDMAPEAFMTYTQFFTHTHNMCFFLESQVWQEQADMTINRLAETSSEVVQKITDSSKLQNEVILKQTESLQNQKIFIERGVELKRLLEDSSLDVHKMLEEFKDTTSEQRDLLFELFSRLTVLHSIVVGEFTGFYSMIFYTLSILISYMLTSTQRTSGSRFWLFLVMTSNIICERLLTWCSVVQTIDEDGNVIDENALMYARLWWCRKVFTSIAILVWCYFAYTFKDLNQINNKLLEQIQKQNADLKRLLQSPNSEVVTAKSVPPAAILTTGPSLGFPAAQSVTQWNKQRQTFVHDISSNACASRVNSSTGYESDTDYSSDSDTQASDRTFIYNADIDNSDAESWASLSTYSSKSSRMSRESTPMLLEELRDIRQATPLREMTPIPGVTVADTSLHSLRSSVGSDRRPPGRPRGSGRRSAPVLQSERPVERYNLRSRRGLTRVSENPIVQRETADEFSKVIRHLSGVVNRNTAKVSATMDRHGVGDQFSSDEY